MQHDILKYLYDISTAINSVKEFTADCKNFNDFDQHKLVKRGVERDVDSILILVIIQKDIPVLQLEVQSLLKMN